MEFNWRISKNEPVKLGETMDIVNKEKTENTIESSDASKDPRMQIKMYTPLSFNEVEFIGADLKKKATVIVDYNYLSQFEAWCTFNFMSGLIYALDGSADKITNKIYIYTPREYGLTKKIDLDVKLKSPYKG